MSETVAVLGTQIARTVTFQAWRGTPSAKFERTDGYFLVDCWFEQGQPRMQIRSDVCSLEEAMTVQVAIGMAIDWFAAHPSADTEKPAQPSEKETGNARN